MDAQCDKLATELSQKSPIIVSYRTYI